MAETDQQPMEFKIDRQKLYREEVFVDPSGAAIRKMIPVNPDGKPDNTRKTVFTGQSHLMTPNGPVPIRSAIVAQDLPQAIKKFPEAMAGALERLVEQAEKMKAKEESRIIVPGR